MPALPTSIAVLGGWALRIPPPRIEQALVAPLDQRAQAGDRVQRGAGVGGVQVAGHADRL